MVKMNESITIGLSENALQVVFDKKSKACFKRIVDAVFNYKPHYNTNYATKLNMNGSVDILLEPVTIIYNDTFPNVSLSLPFGSSICVIVHTIPVESQFVDAVDSISIFSINAFIVLMIGVLLCSLIVNKPIKPLIKQLKHSLTLSVSLLFNQQDVYHQTPTIKITRYGIIIFLVTICSIGYIRVLLSVHFSTQLTVAPKYPIVETLKDLNHWNISSFTTLYTICSSSIKGLPIYEEYEKKVIKGISHHELLGKSEAGKVIAFSSIETLNHMRAKFCQYYPDKRLHVSKPFAQVLISMPIYSYLSPAKRIFINNYMQTIMEMGLDRILFRCDFTKSSSSEGEWHCANQDSGIFSKAEPIPLQFFNRCFTVLIFWYIMLCLAAIFAQN